MRKLILIDVFPKKSENLQTEAFYIDEISTELDYNDQIKILFNF